MNLYDNLNNEDEELQTQARALRNMTTEQGIQSTGKKPVEQVMSERDAQIAEYKQKYNNGLEISPEQYNFITKQLAKSEDPAADESKMAQALLYSRNYGFDLDYSMDNLDALNQARLGKSNSYDISGFRKLKNSFDVGSLTVQRGRAAEKYYFAKQRGEDVTQYRNEVQALDAQIESLSEYVPKTMVGKLFNWSAQTIPYSGHILTAGLIGAGAGSLVPAVGTALGTVTGFAESFRLTKYSQYYDMVEAGVDEAAANWTSTLSGAVQAAVESFLGIESGLTKAVTSGAKGIAGNVLGRAVSNGTMSRIGLLASQYLINATAEGAEELLQEVTEELADNIAYELSDMDIPYSSKDIIKNSLESFMGGFGSALVLGVPATYFNNKATVKYAESLKNDSKEIGSKEVFIKKHLEDDTLADVNETAKKEMLAQVYEKNHVADPNQISEADLATIDVDETINDDYEEGQKDEEGNEIEPEASPILPEPTRTKENRLRTQESRQVRQNADGTETHILKIGSTDSNERYGYVEYTIDEENKTINIDKVATARGYEKLTSEAILEAERPWKNWNVTWNPTSEAQLKVKESLINNSMNPNKGNLNWYVGDSDVDANVLMARELRKSFKNMTQQDALIGAALVEATAISEGLTAKEWLDNRIQSFASKDMKDRGQITIDMNTLKAVVYAGEKADLSTFAHETFHAAILHTKYSTELKEALNTASKTAQFAKYVDTHRQIIHMSSQEAIEAISTMSDNVREWTEAQNELAATLFECYLRDGQTFNEKLKNLFQKIADLFHKIYKAMKMEGRLNDEVIKAYDAILAGNPELAKQVEQNEKTEQGKGSVTLFQNEISTDTLEALTSLGNNETAILHNPELGDIEYEVGEFGKKGHGLLHIVEGRMMKEGATLEEAVDVAIAVAESAVSGHITESRENTRHIDKGDIRAIVGINTDNTIVITGYQIMSEEELAVAKQRAAARSPQPYVRSEEVVASFKKRVNELLENSKSSTRTYSQQAYHGSGAEFEEFLDSKINSGQGSQAFGYGHYFAQSDLIAKDYATDTSFTEDKKQLEVRDAKKEVDKAQAHLNEAKEIIRQMENKSGEKYEHVLEYEKKAYENFPERQNVTFEQYLEENLKGRKAFIPSMEADLERATKILKATQEQTTQRRNLYKVDIPDTGYLNWNETVPQSEVNRLAAELKKIVPADEVEYFDETYGLNSGDVSGQDFYGTIIDILGTDKEASKFLNENGYTGIKYEAGQNFGVPEGAEGTYNYVVFNPKDIKILKSWQYDTDEEARLLKQIDQDPDVQAQMLVTARNFDTIEEYLAYQKDLFIPEQFEENKPDLENLWQRAHGLIQDNYVSPLEVADTEENKDDTFRAMIDTDAGLQTFVDYVREAFQIRRQILYGDFSFSDAAEQEFYEEKKRAAERFEQESTPFVNAIMADKQQKPLSEETKKKIRSTIFNDRVRDYRSLFADIVQDQYLAVGEYMDYMHDIKDPRAAGMSIDQRHKLADRIEGEEVRKAFRNGTEKFDGKIEKALESAEADIAEQKSAYKALYDKYFDTVGKLSKSEKETLQKLKDKKTLERQISNLEQTIRGKLDASGKIKASMLSDYNEKQNKLELINEEIKAIREQDRENASEKLQDKVSKLTTEARDQRKQDRVEAAAKLQEKLIELKQDIKKKEIEKGQLQEARRYKRDLLTAVRAPISDMVDYSYAKQIEALQALLADVSGYQNENITYEGKKYKLADFRKAVEDGTIKIENFSNYQLKRYLNKSLGDMTVAELEMLKDTRDYYENRGRQMWQAKVDERKYQTQQARAEVIADALKNPRYKDAGDLPNSQEEADREDSVGMKARGLLYKTLNMDSKAQLIGNDSEDSFIYRKYQEYYKHRDEEFAAIDKREAPLAKLKEDLKLTDDDLYKPVEIDLGDKVQSFSPSVMNFLYYSQFNEKARDAVAYGVLMKDEKSEITRAYRNETLASQEVKKRGDIRYGKFLSQVNQYRAEHPAIAKWSDALIDEMQSSGDALNQFSIDMYNKPIDLESFYVPLFRKADDGTEVEGQILNNLKNGYGNKLMTSPEKGMLKSKIDISPLHQMPVNMDLFSIAFKTIEQQEHLLAFGKYTREMNDIFKARGSRDVRLAIQNIGGKALMQDVDNFINEAANPHFTSDVQGINPLIDSLRGNLYAGYLGFKMSGMVLQMITSPTAALQYVNPLQLARSLMKMTGQYRKTIEAINARSPYMKSRSIDPTIEMIQKAAKQHGSSKWQNFISKETILLEVADSWSVYAEWDAVYNKKLRELGDASAENEKAAAEYADYAVRKTQPDSDPARIAPLFKSKNAATRALLQFQTSLNIIWNQVAYNIDKTYNTFKNPDSTAAIKGRVFRETLGVMATYALAGAILMAVQNKPDDDDEPKDIIKSLAYGMTTQFTSAVPLVGTYLDRLLEASITGKKGYAYSSSFFPAVDKIVSGAESLITMDKTDDDFNKKLKRALWNIGEGAALFEGLPVSGFKELGYTITEKGFKESLVEGDIDFTFNPSALLGRRD